MTHDRRDLGRICMALSLAAFGLLCSCSRTPPEQALRETVAALQGSIEKRDAPAFRGVLAENFIGPDGLSRDGASQMARVMFLRYRDVGVTLGPLDVDLRGKSATVRFTAALTGGAGGLPESGQLYDVETGWRLADGEWQLVNANWKPHL